MEQFHEIQGLDALDIQEYHQSFVSGDSNSDRLTVEYYFNKDIGHLYAKIFFGKYVQGPLNHVHGGAIAAVFDEAMGASAWANGYPAVTRWMHVDYLHPLRLGTEVLVDTWIEKHVDKEVWCYASMWDLGGTIYAESAGCYIE